MAQCLSQCAIGGPGNKFQGRAAIFPGQPEGDNQKSAGDRKVLPSVERPLAVPSQLDGIGERLEVRDGPLVAVGTASADEVAQQVQVEADEDQKSRESGVGWRAAS